MRKAISETRNPSGVPLLLVDPDPWRTESLARFLEASGFNVFHDEQEGIEPALVLISLCSEQGSLGHVADRLRTRFPEAKVLAFVREVDARTAFPCLLSGVKGILPFDARGEEILSAITCVRQGTLWTPRAVLSAWIERIVHLGLGGGGAFTPSEQRVLDGVREGLSNKEIARRVGVTEATVKFHVGKLLRKTGARDRRDLAQFAAETIPRFVPAAGTQA